MFLILMETEMMMLTMTMTMMMMMLIMMAMMAMMMTIMMMTANLQLANFTCYYVVANSCSDVVHKNATRCTVNSNLQGLNACLGRP